MRSWHAVVDVERGRGTLFGSWTWIVDVAPHFIWIVDVDRGRAHFIWIVDVDRGRGPLYLDRGRGSWSWLHRQSVVDLIQTCVHMHATSKLCIYIIIKYTYIICIYILAPVLLYLALRCSALPI